MCIYLFLRGGAWLRGWHASTRAVAAHAVGSTPGLQLERIFQNVQHSAATQPLAFSKACPKMATHHCKKKATQRGTQ